MTKTYSLFSTFYIEHFTYKTFGVATSNVIVGNGLRSPTLRMIKELFDDTVDLGIPGLITVFTEITLLTVDEFSTVFMATISGCFGADFETIFSTEGIFCIFLSSYISTSLVLVVISDFSIAFVGPTA